MKVWINSGLTSNEGKLSNINVHGQCAQVFIFTALSFADHNIMIADIYISISMGTFEHRKYKSRSEDGNK